MKRIFIQVDEEVDKEGMMVGLTMDVADDVPAVDIVNAIAILYPSCTFFSVDSCPKED